MKLSPGFKNTEIGSVPIDWKVVRVDKIAKVRGGKRLPQGRSLLEDETPHPYIRVSDMKNGTIGLEELQYVPTDVYPLIKRYVISKDDIYVSVAGTLGLFGRVPELLDGANLTENADKITEIDCDRDYLLYSLQTERIEVEIENKRTVGAQPKLAIREIEAFKISLPPTAVEQQAIAKALGDMDGLIASLVALIAKKRDIKQGVMQELLSGHRRLPGFTGEWKNWRLTNIVAMKSGLTITSARISDGEAYRCFGGNGLRGHTSNYTHDGEYVLIGRQGALCGNVEKVSGKFFASEHAIVVTCKAGTVPDFMYYYFTRMNLNRLSEASAQPGLSVNKLLELECKLPPSEEEQRSIGVVLLEMDTEITALEAKLTKTRDIKQGMMQVLLTGEVRLI